MGAKVTHCKYCNHLLKGPHTLLECKTVLSNTATLVYNEEGRLIDHYKLLMVITKIDNTIDAVHDYLTANPDDETQ